MPTRSPSRSFSPSLRPLLFAALGAITLTSCAPVDETGTVVEEVHRVCATASTVRGIDVSIYQGTIDWPAAARGGVDFTFIRQSHGSTADTNFVRNWNGARAAGILHGAYQYFNPWTDPTAQANAIVDGLMAVGFGPGNLPPVLDVEQPRGAGDPPLPIPSDYATRVRTWVGVIRRRLGVQPIIYTGGYYWDAQVGTNEFAAIPMWHAQYFNYPGTIYNLNVMPLPNAGCATSVSNAWARWTFWQFAGGNGRAPGVSGPVDLDVYNGTMAQLQALARVPAPDAGMPDAGRPDSGVRRDAGGMSDVAPRADATASDGAPIDDAASTDDGVPIDDAAVDAGSNVDSGTRTDAAIGDGARDARRGDSSGDAGDTMTPAGCGCRTAGGTRSVPASFVLVGVATAVVSRRRRSSNGARREHPTR